MAQTAFHPAREPMHVCMTLTWLHGVCSCLSSGRCVGRAFSAFVLTWACRGLQEGASSPQEEENGHDLGTSRKSFVVEPETTESEGTASIANSDDRTVDQHDSGTEGRDIAKAASFHSVDQDVTDLQTGMQNVTIEEPAEDTAEDSAKSHASHINAHSPRHADPEVDAPTE